MYPNRTLALSECDKSHLLPDDLTTNFTLRSFACMHTQVTDQPYPSIFIQFSAKISTGFQESGCCKTLSLLSSPFVQFHFKAITGNNRNNQTFIPCKTRSPPKIKLGLRPKTSCSFSSSKSGSHQTSPTRRTILVLFYHLAP